MKYNNKYTVFKPNQLLSDSDLNGNFDYLDAQNRLTRANLIGTGIVCGLDVQISKDGEIISSVTITPGQGITSDGYFIIVPPEPEELDGKTVLTSHRAISVEDAEHILLGTDDNKQNISGEVSEGILELFPNGDTGIPTSEKERVSLLCYSVATEDLKNECGTGDGKGAEETTGVRWLLIERELYDEFAKKIIEAQEESPIGENQYQGFWSLVAELKSATPLKRYDVPVDEAKNGNYTAKSIQEKFFVHLLETRIETRKHLNQSYNAIKPILLKLYGDDHDPFANFKQFDFLDEKNTWEAHYSFSQYYYDFFDDLLKAYEEFRQKGQELLQQCNQPCMSASVFPRHLMLGAFDSSAKIKLSENDRNYFRPSLLGATDGTDASIDELRRLFNRLVEMVSYFNPETVKTESQKAGIRLTPSKQGDVSLSEKAIPFYYCQNEGQGKVKSLHHTWQQEKSYDRVHSYWPDENDIGESALLSDLEQYNFIRIEGHIGLEYQDQEDISVEEEIKNEIKKLRIPIKVISLYSSHDFQPASIENILSNNVTLNGKKKVEGVRFLRQSLSSFLKRNPGVQHKAGAPLGGTFIIVYQIDSYSKIKNKITTDKVIADFFLPYYCCSDDVQPLAVNIALNTCADPSGRFSAVVTPEEPDKDRKFFYQLDNSKFKQLQEDSEGKLLINNLEEGLHTVVVCDSEGTESAKHVLYVPKPLTIEEEVYTYNVKNNTYRVTFEISGGTIPHTVKCTKFYEDTLTLPDDSTSYTSYPIKSGEELKVTITDSNKCSTESKTFHRDVFPCNGKALRCGYRFWFPEPDVTLKKWYNECKIDVDQFILYDEEGKKIDLTETVKERLNLSSINVDDLNTNEKFNQLILSWITTITSLIENNFPFKESLLLQYNSPDTNKEFIGTLWIEHFECLQFEFCIKGSYTYDNNTHDVNICYSHKGTKVTVGETIINIPPFSCIQIDKSDPNRLDENIICDSFPPDLHLQTPDKLEGTTLQASATGKDQASASYLWELQDGTLTSTKEFSIELTPGDRKKVLLTAYTEKGCRVSKVTELFIKDEAPPQP